MMRWLSILVVLLALGGFACEATPPIASPSSFEPTSTGDGLNSDTETITITASQEETGEEIPAPLPTLPTPSAQITSNSGAFTPGMVVTIGVDLTANFSGNPPLVGSLEIESTEDLATSLEIDPAEDGSISFGVYTSATTTAGTYTFFAEQGSQRLTLSIQIIVQE